MQGNPIKIIIADDHSLVRAGFRALLERIDIPLEVTEVSNGREVLAAIPEVQPQIVLMDISMPELNGLETTELIKKEYPDIQIIILSMHAEEGYVAKALNMGVNGYMLKDSGEDELHFALKSILQGETYLSPQITSQVVDKLRTKTSSTTDNTSIFEAANLSLRQREVLQLIAEGKTSKEIGQILGISSKTADAHRYQIMEKLNINDLPGLVRYAIQIGLIDATQ